MKGFLSQKNASRDVCKRAEPAFQIKINLNDNGGLGDYEVN